ncbi:hypothetical protein [Bradyrhizobium quebecense]|uniref:Uncharacterized protein n=2 Tax=Bradyrhizobium quebecense TaxID=2748629 RepID=A0ACD3V5W4_9BRAD|nr:hypothetical protein [Bradyrhizobium quebecense]UGY01826.1 hypothetical protein J4P68_0032700 [Bradyrhizobium quebecense]
MHKKFQRLNILSARAIMMSSQLRMLITSILTWMNVMLSPVLILVAAFVAGFFSGFATRSWRSRKRRAQYRIYAPYVAPPAAKSARREQPVTAFGHMRRAF